MVYTLIMREQTTIKSMNSTIQGYIEVIQCFEREGRYYWISALDCADSVKGYLLVYFNV